MLNIEWNTTMHMNNSMLIRARVEDHLDSTYTPLLVSYMAF